MKHLYVHIPFCRSRCAYCDFASEAVGPHARAGRLEIYAASLRDELAARLGPAAGGGLGAADAAAPTGLQTVYVGGGTPTVLPRDLLLALVKDLAARLEPPRSGCDAAPAPETLGLAAPEFTIEANPGAIDAGLLRMLAEAGVTRLSLGVQSFAPALRTALGRRVTQREVEAALEAIRVTGWREWNLDLVFGIPGQTWDDAAADIDAAVAAGPTHISMYDLTYTPKYLAHLEAASRRGARLSGGAASLTGCAAPPAEGASHFDAVATPISPVASRAGAETESPADSGDSFADRFFADAVARLQAAGYRRYEVSNFALPGHECRHNLAYWRGEDYLGIGAAAVSTVGAERLTNPRSVAGYLGGAAPDVEGLTPEIRLWEKVMLGLRTIEGVDEVEASPVLDPEGLRRLLEQGCLERRCGRLRLNTGFLDVSNAVISALLDHPG
jgi:oxygen-independent coproporphyrinogen III oxidase